MGPEPIPQLDIELSAIQNDLQRKMVEEIRCFMCNNYPYGPKECKKCSKLFCKFCQLQLEPVGELMTSDLQVKIAKMSVEEREEFQQNLRKQGQTPGFIIHCPNCNTPDFLKEINNIL